MEHQQTRFGPAASRAVRFGPCAVLDDQASHGGIQDRCLGGARSVPKSAGGHTSRVVSYNSIEPMRRQRKLLRPRVSRRGGEALDGKPALVVPGLGASMSDLVCNPMNPTLVLQSLTHGGFLE
jgi:hypothetical protein